MWQPKIAIQLLTGLLSIPIILGLATKPVDNTLLIDRIAQTHSNFDDLFTTKVWLVDINTRLAFFNKDPKFRLRLLTKVQSQAKACHTPAGLILAIIHAESAFDPYAISDKGAQGLMQVMPFWKKTLGTDQDNLTDISVNLYYGCNILNHYLKRSNGNLRRALALYNGSLGSHKYSDKVLSFWHKYWQNNN